MLIDYKASSECRSTNRRDGNVEKIREFVFTGRRQTVVQLSEMSRRSWTSVQWRLTYNFVMKRLLIGWCLEFWLIIQTNGEFKYVVLCNNSLKLIQISCQRLLLVMNHGDMITSQIQSIIYCLLVQKNLVKSILMTMLSCFCDVRGIVPHSLFYLFVSFKKIAQQFSSKRLDFWQTLKWFFYHDNAPTHTVSQYLAKYDMVPMVHISYSTDLAPCNFFLFARIKKGMKKRH